MFEKYLHFKSWLFFQSSELVEKVIFLLNQLVSMPQVIKSYILFSSLTKSVGDEAKCRGKSFFSNQQWPMKITTIWTWGSLSLSLSLSLFLHTHAHIYRCFRVYFCIDLYFHALRLVADQRWVRKRNQNL